MQTLSSGQAGIYAVKTPTGYIVERIDSGDEFTVSSREISYLFAGCNDINECTVRTRSEGRENARRAWSADRATRLFVILLDPEELPEELVEVGEALEELLCEKGVTEQVERSIFSAPITNRLDYEAIAAALTDAPLTRQLLGAFVRLQDSIARVRLAFDQLNESCFEGGKGRVVFREAAIDAGCFRGLVLANAGDGALSSALFELYSKLRDQPNSRAIIQAWTSSFGRVRIPTINDMEVDDFESGFEETGGVGGRRAYERVMQQQIAIEDRLKDGDFEVARRFARELVASQRRDSTVEHIAKSLTSLSQRAKELEILDVALEWAFEAVEIKDDDGTAHAQLADLLMRLGRYSEAQQSLDLAELHGEAGFAASGRARILRYKGSYTDALEAYRAANRKFEHDKERAHFNLAGIAECLRDLEQYPLALEAYDVALADYPAVAALHAGRAATLVDMGIFDKARISYGTASSLARNNVVPRNGLASLYRRSGELERAEKEYRNIVGTFSFDLPARAGLIGVLRDLGRFADALNEAEILARKLPASPDSMAILAASQMDAQAFGDAKATLEDAIGRFGPTVRFRTAMARIEKAKGNYAGALAILDETIKDFPTNTRLVVERAELLRKLGRQDEALRIYVSTLESSPDTLDLQNGIASIYLNMKRFDLASQYLHIDEPRTAVEWRNHTLLSVLDGELGEVDRASKRLQTGVMRCPFRREGRFLRAALARLQLRAGQLGEAVRTAEDCIDDATELVKFRALAELGDKGPARALYMRLVETFLPEPYHELRDEIASQGSVIRMPALHDRAWLLDREAEVLILEAA